MGDPTVSPRSLRVISVCLLSSCTPRAHAVYSHSRPAPATGILLDPHCKPGTPGGPHATQEGPLLSMGSPSLWGTEQTASHPNPRFPTPSAVRKHSEKSSLSRHGDRRGCEPSLCPGIGREWEPHDNLETCRKELRLQSVRSALCPFTHRPEL